MWSITIIVASMRMDVCERPHPRPPVFRICLSSGDSTYVRSSLPSSIHELTVFLGISFYRY